MACEGGQCCLNLAETWVSNLLKLNAEKGHEILPQYLSIAQNIPSSLLSLSMESWSGSPKNKQIETKYRNRMYQSPIF
jgi:hypothetical protein